MTKKKPWRQLSPTFYVPEPGNYYLESFLTWRLRDAKTGKIVRRTKVKK